MDTEIRTLLAKSANLPMDVNSIRQDDDLFDLGLNSFACVQVMMSIEERFDIEFPDDFLNRRSFSTISRIIAVVDTIRSRDGNS